MSDDKMRDPTHSPQETSDWEIPMSVRLRYPRLKVPYGKPHPVFDTVQKLRECYLRMGFTEVMNPLIVDDVEVYRQFGPEAPAVLDRVFYLAGLPRPNIGISDEKLSELTKYTGVLCEGMVKSLRTLFHRYKKGEIEGDDLVYEISKALSVSDTDAVKILDEVFPEFKELKPIPTSRTLRSHMTSGWFITLGALVGKMKTPMKLFSVDRCFRREQREDPTRLMTYFSASCVVAGEDITEEWGKAISHSLLSQFGFTEFKFRPDEKRSRYYASGTQTEVFAYHPKLVNSSTKYSDGWVEIATFGVYSPDALAQYDIPYPVMNLGLGVERLAMVLYDAEDMRKMAYPQFYEPVLSDSEIASMIDFVDKPFTRQGWEIVDGISRVCIEHGHEESPCEFLAWEGELFGKKVRVSVVEPEENTLLCGPAAYNEVVVTDGNIIAIIPEKFRELYEKSTKTTIRLFEAFAVRCAYEIERGTIAGIDTETRCRVIRTPAEINLKVEEPALRYITANQKKIDIRGPVFITVRSEII